MYARQKQPASWWALAAVALWCMAIGVARAQDQYVLYMDGFPARKLYLAQLIGLDQPFPPQIIPRAVRLPQTMVELGNPDVSHDGKRIVFPALIQDEWNIYTGTLDVARREIKDVRTLVGQKGVREEDPRYSWDAQEIVYKCDGKICLYPERRRSSNPVVSAEGCELYGPSFHPSGDIVSYTARCGPEDTDRIRISDLRSGTVIEVPNVDGGPDRFSHFLADGSLLYSHEDPRSSRAGIWTYNSSTNSANPFHNRTVSDADPYANKSDPRYVAFVGYLRSFNLYVYRSQTRDSVQLSNRTTVLGPVIFNRSPGN